MTGRGDSQKLVNAYRRDFRHLVLKRSFSVDERGRAKFSIPTWLATGLGYGNPAYIEGRSGWTEALVFPDDGPGRARMFVQVRKRKSTEFRTNPPEAEKLQMDLPREVALDIDLREPQNGILVRPLDTGEMSRFVDAPTREIIEEELPD